MAEDIDERRSRGESVGPMAGMPIVLKDLIHHNGRTTTCGSAFYRHHAESTATCVKRLEDAGAVVIGRTGLHEFAFGFSSENPHFGPVRNPWDTTTSTGGSSGGSAAAVAAVITSVAVGTDTGGSVRVPSALCGTFGLKVSYGRIPTDGVFPLVPSVDTVGPLADSVEHLELAYRAMANVGRPRTELRKLCLAVPQPWVEEAPFDPEISRSFSEAIEALTAIGHSVASVSLPHLRPTANIGYAIGKEIADVHSEFRTQNLPYGADVAERIAAAESTTPEETRQGYQWQRGIRKKIQTDFASFDLMVTPSVPVRTKVIGDDFIGDRHYRPVLSWFTAVVNHALLPAISMPLLGTGAPPASLQAIGPVHSEDLLLAFGQSLQDLKLVGFKPAPFLVDRS